MPTSEQTSTTVPSRGDLPGPAHTEDLPPFLRANAVALVAAAVALALAAVVWFAMPHQHDIPSLWVFLFKLTPFVAGAIAIGWLHVGWAHRLRLPLILTPLTFLVFFCYFVPRTFFLASKGESIYYTVLTLVPFVILALGLAFRFGGGSRPLTLRLCFGMLLLQLSGLEDLAFLTVNHHTDPQWTPIPDVWTWADHMTVFLGHPLTKEQAYAFIAVHVVLALLVFFLPARVVMAVVRRRR